MRKAQLALAVVVVAATRMIACGSTVSASHYDQSCQTAADCVAIGVGDPCSTACAEFPEADAISRKALETYNYDAFSAQYACSHCGSISGCGGNPAASQSAYCVQGTCKLCDNADPCSCNKSDPSCTDAGIPFEGGTEAGADAPSEAAQPEAAPPSEAGQSEAGQPEAAPPADAAHDAPASD